MQEVYGFVCLFLNTGKTTRLLHSLQTNLGIFLAFYILKNGFSLCKKVKKYNYYILDTTICPFFFFFSLIYFRDRNAINVGGGKKSSYSKPSIKCMWNNNKKNLQKQDQNMSCCLTFQACSFRWPQSSWLTWDKTASTCPNLPRIVPILVLKVCTLRS